MEADLAGEGAIGLELGIAVAAGVVHLVTALPGEVDAFAAGVAVDLALDRTESEFTAAARVEPDVSRPEETAQPGAVVTEVARRWLVSPQQVFDWRRQARKALAAVTAPAEPAFVPIVAETLAPSSPEQVAAPARATAAIEIKVAGAVLRVAPGTDGELLTMVLRAIRSSAA
jgi:transposase